MLYRSGQKLSREMIGYRRASGKSGIRMIGLMLLLKAIDFDRFAAVLARAEALAKGRDTAADDAALSLFGEVDPVDWSVEAVLALAAARCSVPI